MSNKTNRIRILAQKEIDQPCIVQMVCIWDIFINFVVLCRIRHSIFVALPLFSFGFLVFVEQTKQNKISHEITSMALLVSNVAALTVNDVSAMTVLKKSLTNIWLIESNVKVDCMHKKLVQAKNRTRSTRKMVFVTTSKCDFSVLLASKFSLVTPESWLEIAMHDLRVRIIDIWIDFVLHRFPLKRAIDVRHVTAI